MQLLPSTATTVAKRSGLPTPSAADLYNPVANVEISGHHLARLMTRYGESRPLVAAAYNARDLLLPKLISGEIDVSDLDIAGIGDADDTLAKMEEAVA